MNTAQKKIVKEAKKRHIESIESNQEETFRKSRLEVRKELKVKEVK